MAEGPAASAEAAVIDYGDFVNKRNYNQAKRQKEQSRKARQQKKLQRRLDRTPGADADGVTETLPAQPGQPVEPADEIPS